MLRGNVRMAPHLWMVFELIAMYVLVLPLRSLLKNASEQTEKLLTLFILVLMGVYSVSHYWKIDLAFSTFLNGWTGVFQRDFAFPWQIQLFRIADSLVRAL